MFKLAALPLSRHWLLHHLLPVPSRSSFPYARSLGSSHTGFFSPFLEVAKCVSTCVPSAWNSDVIFCFSNFKHAGAPRLTLFKWRAGNGLIMGRCSLLSRGQGRVKRGLAGCGGRGSLLKDAAPQPASPKSSLCPTPSNQLTAVYSKCCRDRTGRRKRTMI